MSIENSQSIAVDWRPRTTSGIKTKMVRPPTLAGARGNFRSSVRRCLSWSGIAPLLALLSFSSIGLAVAPRLANILPPGGQRGTDCNVVFSGQRLDDVREVIFYTGGLSAEKIEPGTN